MNNDALSTAKQLIIYYNKNVPMDLGFDNSTADSCAIRYERYLSFTANDENHVDFKLRLILFYQYFKKSTDYDSFYKYRFQNCI